MEFPAGRQADSSLERMQRRRKERNRQREKDESSLRGLAHCQTVDVKSHNYTHTVSANGEQQKKKEENKGTQGK